MASTWRIGWTVPCAACKSWNTWSEKNLTTSTWAFMDVTPCYHIRQRSKRHPCKEERLTCVVEASAAIAPNKYTAESLALQFASLSRLYSSNPVRIHVPTISVVSVR